MEIDRLLEMLANKNSPQAHLVSDEPLRIWNNGVWQSANTPLAAGRLNRMLVVAAPPNVRAVVHDLNANYEFDVSGAGGVYRVHVDVVAGRRSVFVTRLDAHGVPVRPTDDGTSDFGWLPATETEAEVSAPTSPAESSPAQTDSPEAEADQWYYSHADQSMGPYPFEQMTSLVKSGGLLPETMVFNSRVGYWQEVKFTELGRFLPRSNAGEWAPAANWQPPSQADVRREKIFVRSLVGGGIGMVILLLGWIAISQVRGANRARDYSAEAIAKVEELSKNTSSGALHNVRVQHDQENIDVYSGKAQYTNNYLADVSVETTKRDFLDRPQEWNLKVQAHDFAPELEALVRAKMNKKYASEKADFRMDEVSLSSDGNNVYSGTCHWDDHTNGAVSAQITAFDTDGEISTWKVGVDSS